MSESVELKPFIQHKVTIEIVANSSDALKKLAFVAIQNLVFDTVEFSPWRSFRENTDLGTLSHEYVSHEYVMIHNEKEIK